MRKIGIMGGTFDPIHYGHLLTAEEAFFQFHLEKVIFMPTLIPWQKEDRKVLQAEHRYNMIIIATSSNPHFEVSRLEIDRKKVSYTIDTLKELRKIYGSQTELYFITGADSILDIITWKNPDEVLEYCIFIAATRPGYNLGKLNKIKGLEKAKIYNMEIPALAISSTDIRRRIREDKPIRYLLPDDVIEYIKKNNFYKEEKD